jgi:CheY-like chemotaxis protein
MLTRAGFQVRAAENGALGIEAFRQWRPHFIWMDLALAQLNGTEATRRIRRLDGGADVKIAAITAAADASERDGLTREALTTSLPSHFARQKFSSAWRATWVCAIRLRKERETSRTGKPRGRREVCLTSSGCERKTLGPIGSAAHGCSGKIGGPGGTFDKPV